MRPIMNSKDQELYRLLEAAMERIGSDAGLLTVKAEESPGFRNMYIIPVEDCKASLYEPDDGEAWD